MFSVPEKETRGLFVWQTVNWTELICSWSSAGDDKGCEGNRTGSSTSSGRADWPSVTPVYPCVPFVFFTLLRSGEQNASTPFFCLLKQQNNQTLAWLSTQEPFTLGFRGFSDALTACLNFGHLCQWATKLLPRGKVWCHDPVVQSPERRGHCAAYLMTTWFLFPQKKKPGGFCDRLNQQTKAWMWGFFYIVNRVSVNKGCCELPARQRGQRRSAIRLFYSG